MAYIDPQAITVDAVPYSRPRVITGTTVGKFVAADATRELTIDPRGSAKRRRNVARFFTKRIALDPLGSGLSTQVQSMVSVTIDRPNSGTTDADIEKDLLGLIAWLTANTNANLKKFVAGEN
jgi:hypothetical protein